jgi:hypothetical protein
MSLEIFVDGVCVYVTRAERVALDQKSKCRIEKWKSQNRRAYPRSASPPALTDERTFGKFCVAMGNAVGAMVGCVDPFKKGRQTYRLRCG